MSETADILRKAKPLIEKGWCRFALARNRRGDRCMPYSDDAVRFCPVGAVERVVGRFFRQTKAIEAVEALDKASRSSDIVMTNNYGRKTDVLAAFDRAISAESA